MLRLRTRVLHCGEERSDETLQGVDGYFSMGDDPSQSITTSRIQRYTLSISTDDSTPSLAKFFASQSPAHFRPWSRRKTRKSQSALYLLVELSAPMNSSSATLWIRTCGSPSPTIRFFVTSPVTKLTARISRIRDELKLISLMRFKISAAARGTSLRNSGLI